MEQEAALRLWRRWGEQWNQVSAACLRWEARCAMVDCLRRTSGDLRWATQPMRQALWEERQARPVKEDDWHTTWTPAEAVIAREWWDRTLEQLSPRDRTLVSMALDGVSQRALAERYSVTEGRVSQILKRVQQLMMAEGSMS